MKPYPAKQQAKDQLIFLTYQGVSYSIPEKILAPYAQIQTKEKSSNVAPSEIFSAWDATHTRAGALLKGLRSRENMTQIEFAKKLRITQSNLSSMENGRRSIGKDIAKRIEAIFKTNYRYFLE